MKAKQPDSQTARHSRLGVRSNIVITFLAAWLFGFLALALAAPPSGRPPIGPLERYEPKIYDLGFAVTVMTIPQPNVLHKGKYQLEGAPIVMPVVFQGSYSKIESDSVKAQLWLESHAANPHLELKDGFPHNSHLATMTAERFFGQSVRWQIDYRLQVWSSR